MTCSLPWGATILLRPFFGILSVAPRPNYGPCSSVEPREFGGNMDNKEFRVDTSLYLPVSCPVQTSPPATDRRRRTRRAGRRRGLPDCARNLLCLLQPCPRPARDAARR